MGFNRGEIRVKATDISVVDRKGGESILGCRVVSGSFTTTVSAHSHLHGRVLYLPCNSKFCLHSFFLAPAFHLQCTAVIY